MPKSGETLHSISFETGFGGKGANQCIAASRLGCNAAMIGKIGSDPYGIQYKNQFEAEGVNTEFLEVAGEHSGVALIVVSADGENQIVINANANQFLSVDDWEKAKPLTDQAKVRKLLKLCLKCFNQCFSLLQILICQLETPLAATIKALETFKGFSILNGAPAMKLLDEVFRLPNVFCVNEIESEEITGIVINDMTDVRRSIEVLMKKGCQTVIITLGKLGAAFNVESGTIFHMPVPVEVDVVDTVGAGDAFIGALAYFISKFPTASLIQRIGASIEIASHSVRFKGTQTSFFHFPSIDPTTKSYQFNDLS